MEHEALALVPISRPGADGRTFDVGAQGLGPDGVRFGGWQLHAQPSPEYPDHHAYLVRTNYDIVLSPERPDAVTVTFNFGDTAIVLDTQPAAVGPPDLDRHLNFTAGPATGTLGVGTSAVSLRHAQPKPSSYSTWLVLLAGPGVAELAVTATVSHEYPGHTPSTGAVSFTVRLPAHRPLRRTHDGEPLHFRMGFAIDLVGYSRRPEPTQATAQERIHDLVIPVLEQLGHTLTADIRRNVQGTGDGLNVFLPVDVDHTHALADLRRLIVERIAADNRRHHDRQRFRMAVDIGPTRVAAGGFSGNTIIAFCRLVECAELRTYMTDHPDADLGLIVSDLTYATIVSQNYPGLDAGEFQAVDAVVKEYQARAWIWAP